MRETKRQRIAHAPPEETTREREIPIIYLLVQENSRQCKVCQLFFISTFIMSAQELHVSEEHSEAGYDRHVLRQSATEEALSQPRQPFPVTQFSSPQPWATNQAFITGPKNHQNHQNQAYSNGNPNFLMPPFQTPWSQYSLPPYGMVQTITNPQSPFPTFRQIAPKPAEENPGRAACSSGSRPPDFIETVKQIRKELYDRAGGSEDRDPPVLEGKEHSQWRKSVIDRWKPVSTMIAFVYSLLPTITGSALQSILFFLGMD